MSNSAIDLSAIHETSAEDAERLGVFVEDAITVKDALAAIESATESTAPSPKDILRI